MHKVSKKAIGMWALRSLGSKASVWILVLWFVLGDAWIYFEARQEGLAQIWRYFLVADQWLVVGLSVAVVFLIFSAVSGAFYKYLSTEYGTENSDFKIVKGIIVKHENYIPYRNIDSVDIRVGAAQRMWGLASILIFTPGANDKENPEAAEGYIEGIKYEDAIALKDELLKRSAASAQMLNSAQPAQQAE